MGLRHAVLRLALFALAAGAWMGAVGAWLACRSVCS
jgi:hypothetical protein